MKPETKALYPANWAEISRSLRKERHNTCEGCGQLGDRKRNVLTVHHRDGNPANCEPTNLLVLCQICHLKLQRGNTPFLLRIRQGQLLLFPPG